MKDARWALEALSHAFMNEGETGPEAMRRVREIAAVGLASLPSVVTDGEWQKYWNDVTTLPVLFQLVITKTEHGIFAPDWLEPVGAGACFSESFGVVKSWMLPEVFKRVAPPWAQAQLEPLSEETNIERVRRHRLFTSASEEVTDFPDLDTVPAELDSPSHHDMFRYAFKD